MQTKSIVTSGFLKKIIIVILGRKGHVFHDLFIEQLTAFKSI